STGVSLTLETFSKTKKSSLSFALTQAPCQGLEAGTRPAISVVTGWDIGEGPSSPEAAGGGDAGAGLAGVSSGSGISAAADPLPGVSLVSPAAGRPVQPPRHSARVRMQANRAGMAEVGTLAPQQRSGRAASRCGAS